MVLGGQPPGRVGRRRFLLDFGPPNLGGPLSFAAFAARRSSPNGLQPVLAERGEVDRQVHRVGQLAAEASLRLEFRSEHRFDSTDASGWLWGFASRFAGHGPLLPVLQAF